MGLLFWLGNALVLPFWLLMIALPGRPWTARVLRAPWVVAAPATFYVLLALPQLPALAAATRDLSPAGLAALLGTPGGAVLAWVHMLTFDLFVGRWIYFDSRARAQAAPLTSAVLLLTAFMGPLGYGVYLLLRQRGAPSAA
jgi:hypothetical protein